MSMTEHKGITVDDVRRYFHYSPETGAITWLETSARHCEIGQRAGTIGTKGYRFITLKGVKFAAHRLAWMLHYGELPGSSIDHVNGDRDDNRIENLRLASASKNNQNAYREPGESGARNVSPNGYGAWRVRIWAAGRQYDLGTYKDFELAEFIAVEGRRSIHGEYMYDQR